MIKLTNITKTYDKGRAGETSPVVGFSMHVKKGETIILNGPSGSGKTTLLNIIAGLIRPTDGLAEVNGKAVSKLPEHFAAVLRREHIGMIFQQFHLIEKMSAEDNIALPLVPTGLSTHEMREKAMAMMKRLGIENRRYVHTEKLSGGEMQRVATARALVNNPQMILADEPTANLDKKLTENLLEMLSGFKAEGRTVVIATHDPALTDSGLADRVIEMTRV